MKLPECDQQLTMESNDGQVINVDDEIIYDGVLAFELRNQLEIDAENAIESFMAFAKSSLPVHRKAAASEIPSFVGLNRELILDVWRDLVTDEVKYVGWSATLAISSGKALGSIDTEESEELYYLSDMVSVYHNL